MSDLKSYLYLCNLHSEVTAHLLYWIFRRIGPIDKIQMIRNKKCHHSLGYSFIKYQNVEDVEKALELMKNEIIKGKRMYMISPTNFPCVRDPEKCNLYVENLSKTVTPKLLLQKFSEFGDILYYEIFKQDDDLTSRNYAFVHFERQESAQQALKNLNGMKLKRHNIRVILEKDVEMKMCETCSKIVEHKIITFLTPTIPSDYDDDIH